MSTSRKASKADGHLLTWASTAACLAEQCRRIAAKMSNGNVADLEEVANCLDT